MPVLEGYGHMGTLLFWHFHNFSNLAKILQQQSVFWTPLPTTAVKPQAKTTTWACVVAQGTPEGPELLQGQL